eukprot:12227946-Prorocentrum_lima.AAC.1
MARFPEVAERTSETQAEHIPMLRWLARLASERIRKGRIVLFENGRARRALKLDFLADLEGEPDGL